MHQKRSSSGVRVRRWLTLLFVAMAPGCGPAPITGGTSGVLTTDGNPIRDVQVVVYSPISYERLGYAVTGADGSFQLIAADTSRPLELDPGSYVVTLESVGAPTELPPTYLDPRMTPLRIDWDASDRLELNVPGLQLK
jgi:hypothetical protein